MGYRSHTGGKWTEQCKVIHFEACPKIQAGTGSTAYVHSASGTYVQGSAGDDQEKHPTFPVADDRLDATVASNDEESSVGLINSVEDLQTDLGESFLSSERSENHEDLDPADNAGALVVGRQTSKKESQQAVILTKIVGSSRAITSPAGTAYRGPLSFLSWVSPTISRR